MPLHLRYRIGHIPEATQSFLLSRSWFPLYRRFMGGRDWCYDACRFAGTRDFRQAFDVGAHVGEITLHLARFFPRAEIHAFEPIAATHATLSRAVAGRPRLHAHALALSDAPGEMRVQVQAESTLNSLVFAAQSTADAGERVQIDTVAAFCTRHSIDTIDVLKVDAQGFDLAVLRGAEPLLRAGRVPFVVTEAGLQPDDKTNQPFFPLHDYLSSLGYQLAGIYDQLSFGPRLRYLGCFNLLYLHPAALEARFPTARAD